METHRIISLDKFDEVFLYKSNKWLNDPEIQHLIDSEPVAIESQLIWYKGLEERQDYRIWGISCEGVPIGAAGLRHISGESGEFFCYVGEKEYWGGVGRPILAGVESNAIKIGLSEIWLRVTFDNDRARHLYENMGYIIYKKDEVFFFMKKLLTL